MERDPLLRRLEREGVIACGAMAAIALVLRRGNPDAAIGVLAGGLLTATSYSTIKGAIDATIGGAAAGRRVRRRWGAIARGLARYGILAVAAYVAVVTLRLHPAGIVAGATSLVVAAGWEGIRGVRSGRDRPAGPPAPDEGSRESHGTA